MPTIDVSNKYTDPPNEPSTVEREPKWMQVALNVIALLIAIVILFSMVSFCWWLFSYLVNTAVR